MDALRHLALTCCVLCSAAGAVRLFWPENTFKAVINSVLALYIITAGIKMFETTDWQGLTAQLYRFDAPYAIQSTNLDDYRDELARQTTVDAVREILSNSNIKASVTWVGDGCVVVLAHPRDREVAEALLEQNCGQMHYTVRDGGDAP